MPNEPTSPVPPPTPKPPVNTQFEPDLDSLPEDLPAAPSATPKAGAATSTAAPPATTPPAHDAQLVRIAKLLGLSDAMIAARGKDELQRTVETLNQLRLDSIERDFAADRGQTNARHAPPAALSPPPPPPPPEPTFDTEMLPKLDGFPPEMIEAQRALYDLAVKPLREAQKKLEGYEQRDQQRTRAAIFDTLDDAFAALPAEYQAVLGKGGLDEIGDDEKRTRNLIVKDTGIDLDRATKRQVVAAVHAAAKRVFGKVIAAQPAPKPAAEVTAEDYGAAEDESGRPTPKPHHIAQQVRNPDGTVGARTKTQLDDEIEKYNAQATQPPTARVTPGGSADDKPGVKKALRTAKTMLFAMNGAADE